MIGQAAKEAVEGLVEPEKRPRGRPSVFTEQVIARIMHETSEGFSAVRIFGADELPCKSAWYEYLNRPENKTLQDRYSGSIGCGEWSIVEEMKDAPRHMVDRDSAYVWDMKSRAAERALKVSNPTRYHPSVFKIGGIKGNAIEVNNDSDWADPKAELVRRLEQMAENIRLNKTVFGPMLDLTPDSVEIDDPEDGPDSTDGQSSPTS